MVSMLSPKAKSKVITKLEVGWGGGGRNNPSLHLCRGPGKSSIDFLTGQCTDLSDKRIEMSSPESVGSHCRTQPEAGLVEAQSTSHTEFRRNSFIPGTQTCRSHGVGCGINVRTQNQL